MCVSVCVCVCMCVCARARSRVQVDSVPFRHLSLILSSRSAVDSAVEPPKKGRDASLSKWDN
jgi:hypothetical protein